MQEPTDAARATTQLTLSAEVLATLTNSISAALSEALLNVAQPRQSAAAAAAMTFPVAHPSTGTFSTDGFEDGYGELNRAGTGMPGADRPKARENRNSLATKEPKQFL